MISLNENYGFILGNLSKKLDYLFDKVLKPLSITSRHYSLLLIIYQNEDINQKKIGEILKIDRTTMVQFIDYLEDLNYLKRVKNPNDRRSYNLKLTKESKSFIKPIWKIMKRIEKEVLEDLNKEENEAIKNIYLIAYS